MRSTWRSARPGDFCVLLVPKEGDAIPAIQIQRDLQDFFGGRPVNPVHVTCDRFELHDQRLLEKIAIRLKHQAKLLPPIPLSAFSVKTIESDFRGGYILKWLVYLNDPLRQWINFVDDTLDAVGVRRFYSSLGDMRIVTALESIEEIDTGPFLNQATFPQYLFTARQVLLSRILGSGNYEALGHFDLSD